MVARWHREITPTELKAGYEAVLTNADDCGCWRWLLDIRRRNNSSSTEAQEWIEGDFFPRLAGRYEQPVRMAFLISPARQQYLREQAAQNTVVADGYTTATFIDEADAFAWLAQ